MKTTLFNFFKNAGVLLLIATLGMSCSDNDIVKLQVLSTAGAWLKTFRSLF